ncbi:MAG: MarR family transcriptional regulator [Sphingomonadales bacterium]
MGSASKPEIVQKEDRDYVVFDLPVRLTAAELAKLSAASAGMPQAGKPASPFQGPGARVASALERAMTLIDLRKRREQEFGADLFGEPAWDILLDLFIQRIEGCRTSATSASIASRSPTTTALRYIAILERKGLLTKRVAEHDLRVHYVELSDDGYRRMLDLLSDCPR